jgi:hypothetical protein
MHAESRERPERRLDIPVTTGRRWGMLGLGEAPRNAVCLEVRLQRQREPVEQRRGGRERDEHRHQRRLVDEQCQLGLEQQDVDVPVTELCGGVIGVGRRRAAESVQHLLRSAHHEHHSSLATRTVSVGVVRSRTAARTLRSDCA